MERVLAVYYGGAPLPGAWSSHGFDWYAAPTARRALLRLRGWWLVERGLWSRNHHDRGRR